MTSDRQFLIAYVLMAGVLGAPMALAQPASDRVLSSVQAHDGDRCSVVSLAVNIPIQYVSHVPEDTGSQINIRIRPIVDGSLSAIGSREALKAPQSAMAGISRIEYDGTLPAGPEITITFTHPLHFRLKQSRDFQGLILSVWDGGGMGECSAQGLDNGKPLAANLPSLRKSSDSLENINAFAASPDPKAREVFEQAKVALTGKDYPKAIQLLTKFLEGPENASSPDAKELLGVARERNNQAAHAKGEYEEYLKRYPNAPGAGRVQQRLATLLARALHPNQQATPPGEEPARHHWDFRASISEYFYHDEMQTVVEDQATQKIFNSGLTAVQSQLVSALDTNISLTGETFKARFVASGAYTEDLLRQDYSRLRVGQLFLEASDISGAYFARIGRQYRSTGGVLGRIDGAFVSIALSDSIKIDGIGGFPVDLSSAGLRTSRVAYGASIDYAAGGFSGDVYALRQMDGGFIDRQSVGIDARYLDSTFSVFGTADYDLRFQKINVALINGNLTLTDKTSINLSADYRRSPLLRVSDALIGQPVTALSDLLSTYTRAEIYQLALDRTATSLSLFGSVTHPFNDTYSVSVDATIWDMSGMPASGGIPAIPSSGRQYYFSGHFIGTGLLTDGDFAMLGGGYITMDNSNRYTFDLNTRYPITRDFRIGPRVFFSYRELFPSAFNNLSGTQTSIRPSLRLDYRYQPNMEFELSGGPEWLQESLNHNNTTITNYLVDFGVRWDL